MWELSSLVVCVNTLQIYTIFWSTATQIVIFPEGYIIKVDNLSWPRQYGDIRIWSIESDSIWKL